MARSATERHAPRKWTMLLSMDNPMEQHTTIPVVNWLRSQQAVKAAVPVVVQIGRRTYNAVKYTHSENGVDETRLYVLGTLPPLHEKMRRLCYRTDKSDYDWHVVAWLKQRTTTCAEWSEVYPCDSSHFILAEWSPVENWAADQCQKKPFHRTPMTITPCVEPAEVAVNEPRRTEP